MAWNKGEENEAGDHDDVITVLVILKQNIITYQ